MSHSWRGAVALPLTLLGLAALCQATSVHDYKCFKFQRSGIGTIEPNGDIILEVGSSYEAYCLFNPAKVQVDDVFFKTTGNDGRRLDHEVVNSSAIKVQVTHNEPTQYLLKCSAGGDIICRRSVFVGHKPEDVQNFTCVSMNWESLNCSWSVPENPVKVTYSLTYVIQDYTKEPRDCPQRERQQNWCFWHGVDFVSGRQNWTIIFSAINNLTQDPVEFKHNVDLYASVIPGKASNFKVDALGPREVILKWNLPHPIDVFTDGKVTQEIKYRIKPFRNIDDYSPWKVIDTWEYAPKRFNRKTFNRTISDLKPFVEYEFCVRLHTGTGPIREEMWSEPALVVKRTKSTRPMVAPLTTPGMFEIEENKLQRDVYINWQTVDPLEENGPNFTYEVQMFDDSNGRRLRNPQSTERGFIKFRSLENTITYRVEITPMNDHGLPEDPNVKSVVIVPNKASLLDVPDYFKVIAYSGNDTTTYMARWQIPEVTLANTNIETVTLYWCKQTDYENRCQNKLRWEIISDPALGVKSLTGYDPSSRHIFGISVNTHNSSSGIKWSGCIATHGEQQPAIDEFNYTNVLSSEVKLKWDLECKAQAAQPIAFNISYCVLEKLAEKCAEPEKFIKVDGESTVQYTVRNLHAYRDYSFSIATISEELGLGKWSRNVRVKTKPAKPSAAPQNITVVSKGKTWIYLSWNPPPEPQQNGDIAMYDIWYKVKGLPSVPSYVKDNVLQYNFTSLDAFTEYQFDIFACTWVSNEAACGKHPASIEVKTKIGAPGKINSLQYDALWLKWDHDECNGPSCSYELQYTINDTSFTYNTAINISAVPIRDLNITCPVDQGYIPVKLRAVNTDEENQRLTGPQEDWKIPSPCQGSYIISVLFMSNQYNRKDNRMENSETFTASGSNRNPRLNAVSNEIESANIPRSSYFYLSGYSHEDYQYTSEHRFSEQISVDDLNIQQVGFTMRNGQQHSQFSDRVSVQSEPHHGSINYLQKQSQKIGWIPSEEQNYLQFRLLNPTDPVTSNIVNSDNLELQNNYHHRKPVSLDTYEISGREPPTSDRNYTTADGEAQTTYRESPITGREPSIISDQNEFGSSKHRAISDGSSHQISGLLLQLMKAKDVEVLLNTTNENFELKIKGKANFFNLLHNINFPVQNDNEAETELESQNIVHEIKGNDPPTNSVGLIDNEDLYQQDMSDLNESNHTHLALNHNTSFNHIDLNENSNFTTLSPPVIDNNSQNKLDLRVRVFVDSMQNQSSTSALSSKYESHNYQPEDSANNDTSFDGENGSFFTASITNEPNIPIFMNSSESNTDKLSEPSGFDFINISDVSSAQTNNTTFNASESGDMNGSRSRRDITVVPIIISRISQRNQLYLSYFMQGRHKINVNVLNGPNDLPLNNVEGHHERELTPIIESVVNQGIENRADE